MLLSLKKEASLGCKKQGKLLSALLFASNRDNSASVKIIMPNEFSGQNRD